MLPVLLWLAAWTAIVLCDQQVPLSSYTEPQSQSHIGPIISHRVESYINSILHRHKSPGLAVAVVLKDASAPTGFRHQLLGVGEARTTTSPPVPVTPDTLFAIASNSKLFLALSVGLLISNKSLDIDWTTKIASVIPEWKLADPIASQEATILDLLVHRTGMPRHDFAGTSLKGGVPEMISNLRHLRPSAPFRSTFQYNNMMFETLSHLPTRLLNVSFESYVAEHIFKAAGMTATTYSVSDALSRTYTLESAHGTKQVPALAHGHQYSCRDFYANETGVLRPTIPYFQHPGEERVWAGAGGVLTSVRDMVPWLSTLLNEGIVPHTNKTLIPRPVLTRLETGVTVSQGKASYPELSPMVYGPAQWRYTYRGHELIEHGGNNPGFRTQVARFPKLDGKISRFPNATGVGIAVFSNDEDGGVVHESVKWRIIDDLLKLSEIDWYSRYVNETETFFEKKRHAAIPRPDKPEPAPRLLPTLQNYTFSHPAYGVLKPCYVPPGSPDLLSSHTPSTPQPPEQQDRATACTSFLSHPTTQLLLKHTPVRHVPTFVVPFPHTFATHLRLTHWSGAWFNVSVVWGNQGNQKQCTGRSKDIYGGRGDTGEAEEEEGVLVGLDERFEVEWVTEDRENEGQEGLAFRGGIWGMEGPDAVSPEGFGKEGAEVWFERI